MPCMTLWVSARFRAYEIQSPERSSIICLGLFTVETWDMYSLRRLLQQTPTALFWLTIHHFPGKWSLKGENFNHNSNITPATAAGASQSRFVPIIIDRCGDCNHNLLGLTKAFNNSPSTDWYHDTWYHLSLMILLPPIDGRVISFWCCDALSRSSGCLWALMMGRDHTSKGAKFAAEKRRSVKLSAHTRPLWALLLEAWIIFNATLKTHQSQSYLSD